MSEKWTHGERFVRENGKESAGERTVTDYEHSVNAR